MMNADDIRTLADAVRADLLREAERDRLAAQLPSSEGGLRALLATWLHGLADRLHPTRVPPALACNYTGPMP